MIRLAWLQDSLLSTYLSSNIWLIRLGNALVLENWVPLNGNWEESERS